MTLFEIKGLTKQDQNATLFSPVNLSIHLGEIVVVQTRSDLGNLFLQTLIGLRSASGGEVLFRGEQLKPSSNHWKQLSVFFLMDQCYERLTVEEYLQFFIHLYHDSTMDIHYLLRLVGLLDKRHIKNKQLSESEKRRLLIGRCLVNQPDLIIMEDPEYKVDLESRMIIRQLLKQLQSEGKAILLTSTSTEEALSISNQVYQLDEQHMKKLKIEEEPDQNETIQDDLKQESQIVLDQSSIRFDKISAKVKDKILLFDPLEINFVESIDGTSHLHVKDEKFPCELTLNQLEQKLQAFGFFRCHRSYIVNLQRVREVIKWTRNSYSLILDDVEQSQIPLSKGKMEELKQIIGI